jgi:D-alanyl-D-alanine carboxypeptidase
MGVSVRLNGATLYSRSDRQKRTPASNQKLLMSMALFDQMPPSSRIPTFASAPRSSIEDGVIDGNLWLQGRGDPSVTDGGPYARSLYFKPTRLGDLARSIKSAGIKRITGRVFGATGYFAHDWYADGWKPDFAAEEVPLPTALTFDGNRAGDTHIADPERRAADGLMKRLRKIGVRVGGPAAQGDAPPDMKVVARVSSKPLKVLLTHTNRRSSNFFAEVLGKRLGVERYGKPGTIKKGAQATRAFALRHGIKIQSHDSSGLSYSNRVSPRGMTALLTEVETQPWVGALRKSLAKGNQGTLEDRLGNVRLRAKTGSLENISTLSGWVWLKRVKTWGTFSIMSRGMDKTVASRIEDRIVRIVAAAAH